jgi:hypothetical protein
MRLGQPAINLQRADRRNLCLRERVVRREGAVADKDVVRIGESRIRKPVAGVEIDRPLEVFDSLFESLGGAFVPVESALEVEMICLGVFGVTLAELFLLNAAQLAAASQRSPSISLQS